MKRKILLFLILFSVQCTFLFSVEINDSCYQIIGDWEQQGFVIDNPDSVLIDTCACAGIPWEQCDEKYAKQWYRAIFPNGVFHLPEYPYDTTIYVTLEDMDTNFSEIRQKFIDLETMFGSYQIIKEFPHRTDSSITARSFLIRFDNYCKFYAVNNFMQININGWNFKYQNRVSGMYTNIYDKDKNYQLDIYAYPNPVSDIINIKIPLFIGKKIEIEIYTDYGEFIKKYIISNIGYFSISVNNYENGVYFLKINNIIRSFVILH